MPAPFGQVASQAEITTLAKVLEGKTDLAARDFLRPHLGKRLTVSGPLLEAKAEEKGVAAVTVGQWSNYVAVLLFRGKAMNSVPSDIGADITASGGLLEIDPDNSFRLDDCRIEG